MSWSLSFSHEVQIQVAITKVRHHSVTLRSRRSGRASVSLSELLAYGAKMVQDVALYWAAAAGSFEKATIVLSRGMDIKILREGPL